MGGILTGFKQNKQQSAWIFHQALFIMLGSVVTSRFLKLG
jgi:hypothetical protein